MIDKNISFIGVGHISHAIITGLFEAKAVNKNKVILAGPHPEKFADLKRKYGVRMTSDNIDAAKTADIIFIAVRPKVVKEVAEEIKNYIKCDSLIISVAAGVTFELLNKYFTKSGSDLKVTQGLTPKIVRIMPNIPVAYGLGVVGWIGDNLTTNDKILIKSLLKPLGLIIESKDEETMDKLSMISGCGIGYVAYFMNNLEMITKAYGFSIDETRRIVNQVFSGTNRHLEVTHGSPEELMKTVATKGGITEEVLNSMEQGGFFKLFSESVKKGYNKIGKI